MDIITSRQNKIVARLVSLKDKKTRDSEERFVIDGKKLFFEAREKNAEIEKVICSSTFYDNNMSELSNLDVSVVSDSVFSQISSEHSPQGIMCIIKYLDNIRYEEKEIQPDKHVFVCVDVQDPGNAGTIIRSSFALGCDILVFAGECADIYNQKTVRASMGSIFKQKTVIYKNPMDAIEILKSGGYKLFAATLDKNSRPLSVVKMEKKDCFIVGNEGHGLSKDVINECDGSVYIPMHKGAESLNVSQAATILLWDQNKFSL